VGYTHGYSPSAPLGQQSEMCEECLGYWREHKLMKGYWWQCENEKCDNYRQRLEFQDVFKYEVVAVKDIGQFIRIHLFPSGWDQNLLARKCAQCHGNSLRITYEYERKTDLEKLTLVHIVGIGDAKWLGMMWESIAQGSESEPWFSFNYLYGKGSFGLNKAVALSRIDLKSLFVLYTQKVGLSQFP